MKTSRVHRRFTLARLPALLVGLLLGIAVTAPAEDNTTNIISGFTADLFGTDLVIGSTGTNNYGQIDSAGAVTNVGNFYIGFSTGADWNAALVTDPGSFLQINVPGLSAIGVNGSFNNLTLANGGVTSGGIGVIGHNPGSTGNSVLVTDADSAWNLVNDLIVGHDNSSANSLTVADGGQVTTSAGGIVGDLTGSDGNTALVTGAGSAWQLAGILVVGNRGKSNTLTIAGGAAVTNTLGVVGADVTSSDNSVLVTGSGSVWANTELQVGLKGPGNTLTIAAGAQVWTIGSTLTGRIGAHTDGTSANNTVAVTGVGSFWQMDGQLFVGEYGSSNSLVITDGGKVAGPRPIVGAGAAGFPSPDYNAIVVSGTGSAFIQTNSSGLPTSNMRIGSLGSYNRLIITNGGLVDCTWSDTRIASGATSSNNTALVNGSGSRWRNAGELVVGRGGPGNNSLIIAEGGVVESVCGSIGSAGCNNNSVAITGAGSAWDLGGCDLTVPRGGVTTSTSNLLIVAAGGWVTNVVNLSVFGLGSAIYLDNGNIAASTVTLESDTILSGRGAIKGGVTANAGATVEAGLGGGDTSALTIDGTCNLAGTTLITLNRASSPNASKLTVSGALTIGGTLTVVNAGDPLQAGDSFSIYSAATVSGSFSETNLPTLAAGLQWAFDPAAGTLAVEGPPALQFGLSGSTLTLAWPPANLGWIAQSNSVSVADAGSWYDIANSQTDTNLTITIDPAQTNVFYRLRRP